MRIHTQNLNTDRKNKPLGSKLWKGRGWLFLEKSTLGLEWYFGKHAQGNHAFFEIDFVSKKQVLLSLSIGRILCFCLSFRSARFPSRGIDYGKRTLGFSVHDSCLWLDIWSDRTGWGPNRTKCLCPKDWLLGKSKYSERELEIGRISFDLPEGKYDASYRLFESFWKRPRWPWPSCIVRVDIEPDVPIPVPGKGENSWDLEDDAIFSMVCPAKTANEAAEILASSAMKTRKRHGGLNWKPNPSIG